MTIRVFLKRGRETVRIFRLEDEDRIVPKKNVPQYEDEIEAALKPRIVGLNDNRQPLTHNPIVNKVHEEPQPKEVKTEYKPQENIQVKSTFIPEETKKVDATEAALNAFGISEKDFNEPIDSSSVSTQPDDKNDVIDKYEREYGDMEQDNFEKMNKKKKNLENF